MSRSRSSGSARRPCASTIRLELERLEEEVEPGADGEADEALVAPVPRVEDTRLRSRPRTEARAEREQEVAHRDVEHEPRPEAPRPSRKLGFQARHRRPQARRGLARRRPGVLREPVDGHRRPERDPPAPEERQPLRARDRGRHERHAGGERDPSRPRVRPSDVLLLEALRPACPLGEDPDDVPVPRERDCAVDRVRVAFAAADGKDAEAAQDRRGERLEQLRLPHPAELARVERVREREAVEVRELVRGEDEAARTHVLEAGHAGPEDEPHEGPGAGGDQPVESRLLLRLSLLRKQKGLWLWLWRRRDLDGLEDDHAAEADPVDLVAVAAGRLDPRIRRVVPGALLRA